MERLTSALVEIENALQQSKHEVAEAKQREADLVARLEAESEAARAREQALLEANGRLLARIDEMGATILQLQAQVHELTRAQNQQLIAGTAAAHAAADALVLRGLGSPRAAAASHSHSHAALQSTPGSSSSVLAALDHSLESMKAGAARDVELATQRLRASASSGAGGGKSGLTPPPGSRLLGDDSGASSMPGTAGRGTRTSLSPASPPRPEVRAAPYDAEGSSVEAAGGDGGVHPAAGRGGEIGSHPVPALVLPVSPPGRVGLPTPVPVALPAPAPAPPATPAPPPATPAPHTPGGIAVTLIPSGTKLRAPPSHGGAVMVPSAAPPSRGGRAASSANTPAGHPSPARGVAATLAAAATPSHNSSGQVVKKSGFATLAPSSSGGGAGQRAPAPPPVAAPAPAASSSQPGPPIAAPTLFALLRTALEPSALERLMAALAVFNKGQISRADLLGEATHLLGGKTGTLPGSTSPTPLLAAFEAFMRR